MDAISMERALIEDQEEMASHWQRQRAPSQVTEVSDMIDERLSFANANSVPLPKFGTKSTNDSAVETRTPMLSPTLSCAAKYRVFLTHMLLCVNEQPCIQVEWAKMNRKKHLRTTKRARFGLLKRSTYPTLI